MKTILLTGASGEIGRRYYAASRGRRRFVLADVRVPDFEPGDGDRFEQVDLCDRAACERLVLETRLGETWDLLILPDPGAFEAAVKG